MSGSDERLLEEPALKPMAQASEADRARQARVHAADERPEAYVPGPTGRAPLTSESIGDPGEGGDDEPEDGAVGGVIAGTAVAGPIGGVVGGIAGALVGSAGAEASDPEEIDELDEAHDVRDVRDGRDSRDEPGT